MRDFNMVKKIGKNISCTGILFLILMILSSVIEKEMLKNDVWVPKRNKNMYRIQREAENTIDVVVVGDSLSYCTLSPLQLWNEQGITSYVCGQPAQKISETYHMLDMAFRTQSPKVVLLETNVIFREKLGINNLKTILDQELKNAFPVVRGHDLWKNLIIHKNYKYNTYKGFQLDSMIKPYTKGKYMRETEDKENIIYSALLYLDSILKLCQYNKAELVLFSAPSPHNYNYRIHNSINEFAADNNLPYLDFNLKNEELQIDWNVDTSDAGDHLNLAGAQKVTKYVGEYLGKNYLLPDHRGQKGFEAWTEMNKAYQENAKKCLQTIQKSAVAKEKEDAV